MFPVYAPTITNKTDIDIVLGLSTSGRGFLIFFNVIIIIFGVSGNSIVLYASMIHKALNIDRASLMLLENLAITDILITLVYFVPMLITLSAHRWVLGFEFCFLSAFIFQDVLLLNEIFITVSISCYRMWMIKTPPAVRENIPSCYVKIVMGIILFLSFALYLDTSFLEAMHFIILNHAINCSLVYDFQHFDYPI